MHCACRTLELICVRVLCLPGLLWCAPPSLWHALRLQDIPADLCACAVFARSIVVCSTITAGLLLPKPRNSSAIPIRAPGASALTILNPDTGTPVSNSSSSWPQNAKQQPRQQQLLSPALQFDLVVVDEAGQGLAPEVLLPLSLAKAGVSVSVKKVV
jgi:hypothetical protein